MPATPRNRINHATDFGLEQRFREWQSFLLSNCSRAVPRAAFQSGVLPLISVSDRAPISAMERLCARWPAMSVSSGSSTTGSGSRHRLCAAPAPTLCNRDTAHHRAEVAARRLDRVTIRCLPTQIASCTASSASARAPVGETLQGAPMGFNYTASRCATAVMPPG